MCDVCVVCAVCESLWGRCHCRSDVRRVEVRVTRSLRCAAVCRYAVVLSPQRCVLMTLWHWQQLYVFGPTYTHRRCAALPCPCLAGVLCVTAPPKLPVPACSPVSACSPTHCRIVAVVCTAPPAAATHCTAGSWWRGHSVCSVVQHTQTVLSAVQNAVFFVFFLAAHLSPPPALPSFNCEAVCRPSACVVLCAAKKNTKKTAF